MTSLRLKLPQPFCSRLTYSLVLFVFLLIGGSWQSALAQDAQSRPVARLINGSVDPPSRPRRVSPGLDASAGQNSLDLNQTTTPTIDDATAIERRAFERTNDERAQQGLAPLIWDPALYRMARVHSEDMARHGFFSHQTPEGLRLKDRARMSGLRHFRVLAENIAYNRDNEDPGGFAVARWMISPAHRANILYSGFQTAAIGTFVSADGTVYITQLFITR